MREPFVTDNAVATQHLPCCGKASWHGVPVRIVRDKRAAHQRVAGCDRLQGCFAVLAADIPQPAGGHLSHHVPGLQEAERLAKLPETFGDEHVRVGVENLRGGTYVRETLNRARSSSAEDSMPTFKKPAALCTPRRSSRAGDEGGTTHTKTGTHHRMQQLRLDMARPLLVERHHRKL